MTASIRNIILYKTYLSVKTIYQINYIGVSIYIAPTSIIFFNLCFPQSAYFSICTC